MNIASIIALGNKAGDVINNAFAQLPTRDQRVMNEFFKFLDRIDVELVRADMDHDDLIVWKSRKDTLMNTVLTKMRSKGK